MKHLMYPLLWLTLGATACAEPGAGPRAETDTILPAVHVTFPDSSGKFDLDGDGFVDIVAQWKDNGSIDASSAELRIIGDSGAVTSFADWAVIQRTSNGLQLKEELAHLLPAGRHQFELSVSDKAGNVARDTFAVELPASQFWKTIETRRPLNGWPVETTFCDDGRAYVASGTSIVVIDAARAELLSVIPDPYTSENLQTPYCIPGDSLLYVTPGAEQMRLKEQTWRFWPRPGNQYSGIAQSRSNPDLLYLGENLTADVAVVSRSSNSRLRRLSLPYSEYPEDRAFSLAVMPNDEKLYVTRGLEGGILVVDPKTGALLKRIAPTGRMGYSSAPRIKLSADSRFLYAAVQDADVRGIAEIDTRTDRVARYMSFAVEADVPTCLGLSPSGRRLFVVTKDRWQGMLSSNYMIDISSWSILKRFFRDHAYNEMRSEGCPAFRPDGKLVLVPRNMDIDVYLNRE